MSLSEFSAPLKLIHEKLNKTKMEWFVTGKGSLALQGMDVKPSRLQLLIHEVDLNLFLSLFQGCEMTPIEELENGEAKEFKMFLNGVEVLVCAEYPHGAYWVSMKEQLQIKLGGIDLPCLCLETERGAYEKMGLKETSKRIDDFLNELVLS